MPVRDIILTLLIGLLALVNYRGVRGGTQLSNVFTLAKLLPLGVVIVAGVYHVATHHAIAANSWSAGSGAWLKAMLLLVFAYGGFETALTPMSEAKDPR